MPKQITADFTPLQGVDVDSGAAGGVNLEKGTTTYKFHVTYCRTFYQRSGSFDGCRAFRRSSDQLKVNPHRNGRALPSRVMRMHLCMNCRKALGSSYFEPFSFSEYIRRSDTYRPRLRKVERLQSVKESYTPEPSEAREAYRRACDWRCMSCEVDCAKHPDLLVVYEVDGTDAEETKGIRVLCVACRANESGQGSIRTTRKDDIARARALRRASGDGALASTTGAQ